LEKFNKGCRGYGKSTPEMILPHAKAYYDFLVAEFSLEFTNQLIPELVKLIDDYEKRRALMAAANLLAPAAAPAPPPVPAQPAMFAAPAAPAAVQPPPPVFGAPPTPPAPPQGFQQPPPPMPSPGNFSDNESDNMGPTAGSPGGFSNGDVGGGAANFQAGMPVDQLIQQLAAADTWAGHMDEQDALKRVTQYVDGLCNRSIGERVVKAWHIKSTNEWGRVQSRIICLTTKNYCRVKFDKKHGKIDHYFKLPLVEITNLEERGNGLTICSFAKDGKKNVAQFAKSKAGKADFTGSRRAYTVVAPENGNYSVMSVTQEICSSFKTCIAHARQAPQ
jgi:hypothetical protein